MAGRSSAKHVSEADLSEQLRELQDELHAAIAAHDGLAKSRATVARLQEQVWNQLSLVLMSDFASTGDAKLLIAATKASTEAVGHGKLAIASDKATHGDRLTALELALKEGRTNGAGIRSLAAARKRG